MPNPPYFQRYIQIEEAGEATTTVAELYDRGHYLQAVGFNGAGSDGTAEVEKGMPVGDPVNY